MRKAFKRHLRPLGGLPAAPAPLVRAPSGGLRPQHGLAILLVEDTVAAAATAENSARLLSCK